MQPVISGQSSDLFRYAATERVDPRIRFRKNRVAMRRWARRQALLFGGEYRLHDSGNVEVELSGAVNNRSRTDSPAKSHMTVRSLDADESSDRDQSIDVLRHQ